MSENLTRELPPEGVERILVMLGAIDGRLSNLAISLGKCPGA